MVIKLLTMCKKEFSKWPIDKVLKGKKVALKDCNKLVC